MSDLRLSELPAYAAAVEHDALVYAVPPASTDSKQATADQLREVERWDDLRIVPSAFDFPGSSDPTLIAYQPGGSGDSVRVYEFAANNEAYFTIQLPHTYKEGTDLHPHVHWTPGPNGVAEDGNAVAWELAFSVANRHGAFGPLATVSLPGLCTGVAHRHETANATSVIDGSALTISAMLLCRIKRLVTGDTWVGTVTGERPILLEVDFHHRVDFLGSAQEFVKAHA